MGTTVVTGAASGIGAATRERLEADGHRTIGGDRHEADVVADLGSPEGRRTAIDKIRAASHGILDGVVSAAEATLPGAEVAVEIPGVHTFVMRDAAVLERTIAFLAEGS